MLGQIFVTPATPVCDSPFDETFDNTFSFCLVNFNAFDVNFNCVVFFNLIFKCGAHRLNRIV